MQNNFIENSTTQLAQKDNGQRLITYLSARDNKAWFDFFVLLKGSKILQPHILPPTNHKCYN